MNAMKKTILNVAIALVSGVLGAYVFSTFNAGPSRASIVQEELKGILTSYNGKAAEGSISFVLASKVSTPSVVFIKTTAMMQQRSHSRFPVPAALRGTVQPPICSPERLARASASPTRSGPEGSSRNEPRLGRCPASHLSQYSLQNGPSWARLRHLQLNRGGQSMDLATRLRAAA